jgi:hypothetical protein
MQYVMKGKDLYIVNSFSQMGGLFTAMYPGEPVETSGAMRIKDFDFKSSPWGVELYYLAATRQTGDLGMLFKDANVFLARIQLIDPVWGMIGGMIDEVFNLAQTVYRYSKSLAWSSGVDPLVLDLDGDGLETVAIGDQAVYFDVDGDFFGERTGWLKGDDGFLTLDLNRNGRIDDIGEMFGSRSDSGFGDLSALDSNRDGAITAADSDFGRLTVWQDRDQDGLTDAGELKTLTELGIARIGIAGATAINITTPQGTLLRAENTFTRTNGTTGAVLEAVFAMDDIDTVIQGETGLAPWMMAAGAGVKGYGRTEAGVFC